MSTFDMDTFYQWASHAGMRGLQAVPEVAGLSEKWPEYHDYYSLWDFLYPEVMLIIIIHG